MSYLRPVRARRGFFLLSMLMALAIIGILTTSYMTAPTPGGKPWAVTQTDRARAAVAAINFRTAQASWLSKTGGAPIRDVNRLRRELDSLAHMGGGGRFFVDGNQQLHVTTQLDTPLFRERFPFERTR